MVCKDNQHGRVTHLAQALAAQTLFLGCSSAVGRHHPHRHCSGARLGLSIRSCCQQLLNLGGIRVGFSSMLQEPHRGPCSFSRARPSCKAVRRTSPAPLPCTFLNHACSIAVGLRQGTSAAELFLGLHYLPAQYRSGCKRRLCLYSQRGLSVGEGD